MNADELERIETKIAFLERANSDLSDVVFRQQQEIQALRARLQTLAQRVEASESPEMPPQAQDERPPHY